MLTVPGRSQTGLTAALAGAQSSCAPVRVSCAILVLAPVTGSPGTLIIRSSFIPYKHEVQRACQSDR